MNTSEIRKQANAAIKGKQFKATAIFLIYILFTVICCFVPFIGSIFITVMSIPLSYGVISSIIKLKRNEDVGYFDFISISFSEFGNAWRITFSMLGKLWPYLLGYFLSFVFIFVGTIGCSILGAASATISENSDTGLAFLIPLIIIMLIGGIAALVFYILFILKSLYYSLSYYILYDNKELKGKEIVEKSYEMMKGNRWNFVKLQIPYYLIVFAISLISVIVLGILSAIFESAIFMIFIYIVAYLPTLIIIPFIQFAITEFYETLKS